MMSGTYRSWIISEQQSTVHHLTLMVLAKFFYTPKFIVSLAKYFLPHAILWSGMMLGDLGRHGTSPAYQNLSKFYDKVKQSKKQNFTEDNRTQGIMEKSQWDLKRIRLQRRQFSRLDDFVRVYQKMHDALLFEYGDTERCRKKVWDTVVNEVTQLQQHHNK
ncbi:Inactive ubiquitin carboxyl-terminal hydrolase 50 [Labeo rohita]|uniref:Inactive ubiquitin carboxyl-terminal hydrolase 50 n=1 Tax=Labeo rohita TaxID=84645 RepID=A0ABQ8LB20_LABRO|nr:Inactive ubiquitin carboxyl-terminal hydrolase 50 [Labeo rohita]